MRSHLGLLGVVVASIVATQVYAQCIYTSENVIEISDSEDPQEISDVIAPINVEGVDVHIEKYIEGTVRYNAFRVEVQHSLGSLFPNIIRNNEVVDININDFVRFLPNTASSSKVETWLTAGVLQMLAYHLDDHCVLPSIGASLLLHKYAGVNAQTSDCPILNITVKTPFNKCVSQVPTGYALSECPPAPAVPTTFPSHAPTLRPTTLAPTVPTTTEPTDAPVKKSPTDFPSPSPTDTPTISPTANPTLEPTTFAPTDAPTFRPTLAPTLQPTRSCFESAQIEPCEDNTECYEASFGQAVKDEVQNSDQLDEVSKNLSLIFLELVTCHRKEDIPDFCLFLDGPSCTKAVDDGFCGDVNIFQLSTLNHLDSYPRPTINCYPFIDPNLCEPITDEATCNNTVDTFLGFNRECIWLNLEGGGNLCRSPANLNRSDCSIIATSECTSLAPVCVLRQGSCEVACEGLSETDCNNEANCQFLSLAAGGGFCSIPVLFPGSSCIGLDETSCLAAQATDLTNNLLNTQDACVWDGSQCDPKKLLELGEEQATEACHPGHSVLELNDGSTRKISDIEIGDMVKTDSSFEPVISIIHAVKNMDAVYYRIAGDAAAVEISRGHMMLVNGILTDPKDVKIGDTIHGVSGLMKVIDISLVARNSAYHIYTPSGRYYVDSILVSDKHGLASESWGPVTNALFALWKKFAYLRYAVGMPIINNDKVVWFGAVMRTLDRLPVVLKLPLGAVIAPVAFMYGNLVTLSPVVSVGLIACASLWRNKCLV